MIDEMPYVRADHRSGVSGSSAKGLFRRAKVVCWLLIRRNVLKGGRSSQADCVSGEFESGSID
jgi:hypothetical protein